MKISSASTTDLANALLSVGAMRIYDFLDPAECAAILREVKASSVSTVGTVLDKDADAPVVIVDPLTRKARHVKVSDRTKAFLRERFEALLPVVAARFRKKLTAAQDPQLIAYAPGDFFVFHRDTDGAPNEPPHVRARKVALVLFINDEEQGAAECGYEGGALQLYAYDVVSRPEYAKAALSVHGKAGLLVAFDPRTRHQVQPVRSGERVTVVCWFE